MQSNERRKYQRAAHLPMHSLISIDGKKWIRAIIDDLSSSGVQLFVPSYFELNSIIWLNIKVQIYTSHVEIDVKGEVVRIIADTEYNYGIKFIDITPEKQIQIDEVVHYKGPFHEKII